MKLPRRQFLHLAAGAAALPTFSRMARAQAYPTRPVRLIVPLALAGASDITERDLWNVWFGHSGLIFAALVIGHHFSTSDLWKAGEALRGLLLARGDSKPSSPKRARTPGSASVYTIAPLSLMMMSRGVPLGANWLY